MEEQRLQDAYQDNSKWLSWGPYLSERQWGTVREDYSANGDAWNYFPHEQSRSRAYRWGEDGLAGFSDSEQRLCFSVALWNERDPILKERLFGLTNSEGNHGEDVKEYYFYLDNTPTHSYMKWLYKYPQTAFPYSDLVNENARRKADPHSFEYELIDTGVFNDDRYFDVQSEYAKVSETDTCIKITVTNHGPDTAKIHVLPTLWCRNTWSWENTGKPTLKGTKNAGGQNIATIQANPIEGEDFPQMMLYANHADDLLFVENETNFKKVWGGDNTTPYPKDGINDFIISKRNTVNPDLTGTKASVAYLLELASGESKVIELRLTDDLSLKNPFDKTYSQTFDKRVSEADSFYDSISPADLNDEQKKIQRQAYAGMLWSKQFYNYIVADWLKGDSAFPPPPEGRDRNINWQHMYAKNIFSMPDAWEYPWFAAWDLCFQTVVFSRLDMEFAKNQLRLLAHEWYMSPQGAIPGYEWSFSDNNPPLHAWAALKLFEIEKETKGEGDTTFLTDIFNSCLINFTWWSNQEDANDDDLFEGGFLGLDNISVINRSNLSELESLINKKVTLKQSDATSWMGMFSLKMMEISLILSKDNTKGYADLAVKFFQYFVLIADAMNNVDRKTNGQVKLWDETDGFYYDFLTIEGNETEYQSIKLRSLVGIIALFPVSIINFKNIEENTAENFKERIKWFTQQHSELLNQIQTQKKDNEDELLLSFVNPERLARILERVLDESEFLSPHGIRGISKEYQDNPFTMNVDGETLTEQYAPAESTDSAFGGNSNWRGPVWFPINFLLIETLLKYHEFLGDDYTVEFPANSGQQKNLKEISGQLMNRLVSIFEKDQDGKRPVFGGTDVFQNDPNWDHFLFYEYFHGDNGAGLGASHQTGWTGLVAEILNHK